MEQLAKNQTEFELRRINVLSAKSKYRHKVAALNIKEKCADDEMRSLDVISESLREKSLIQYQQLELVRTRTPSYLLK